MLAHSFTLRSVWARSVHLGLRGAYALPHPKKAHRGGEDAFFSHENGIGVADGVGGYAQHGIDPAIFTRNVMRFALDAVKNHCNKPGGISALDTLEYAADHARRAGQPGGCPVTLVTLTEDASASILNLGDCGTMLLRGKDLVLCTQVQQHYFNCPYQLPEDPPSSGNCTDVKLEIGDLLLCASDGVLDNVELDDLVAHLREVDATGCGGVASAIGKQAFRNAQDPQFVSPFAKHARNAGYQYSGGKLDDITVVIAKVTAADHSDGKDVACPPLITDLLSINA